MERTQGKKECRRMPKWTGSSERQPLWDVLRVLCGDFKHTSRTTYPNLFTLVLGIQIQVHILLQQILCIQPSLQQPPPVFIFIFKWRQSLMQSRDLPFSTPLSVGITDVCYQTCYAVQRIGLRVLYALDKHSAY